MIAAPSVGCPAKGTSLAGVKIVGDYVDNWQKGLPSEMALLNLFDPRTGKMDVSWYRFFVELL